MGGRTGYALGSVLPPEQVKGSKKDIFVCACVRVCVGRGLRSSDLLSLHSVCEVSLGPFRFWGDPDAIGVGGEEKPKFMPPTPFSVLKHTTSLPPLPPFFFT